MPNALVLLSCLSRCDWTCKWIKHMQQGTTSCALSQLPALHVAACVSCTPRWCRKREAGALSGSARRLCAVNRVATGARMPAGTVELCASQCGRDGCTGRCAAMLS